jgi:nuclear migration protein JNM1
LTPLLPHIPHILARLRTLSALHESAAEFNTTLSNLEAEQQKVRGSLEQMETALIGIEKSVTENRAVVGRNIKGLEERVGGLVDRVDTMSVHS